MWVGRSRLRGRFRAVDERFDLRRTHGVEVLRPGRSRSPHPPPPVQVVGTGAPWSRGRSPCGRSYCGSSSSPRGSSPLVSPGRRRQSQARVRSDAPAVRDAEPPRRPRLGSESDPRRPGRRTARPRRLGGQSQSGSIPAEDSASGMRHGLNTDRPWDGPRSAEFRSLLPNDPCSRCEIALECLACKIGDGGSLLARSAFGLGLHLRRNAKGHLR